MKLTNAQERAKAKLTNEWQCAYTIKESMSTLNALVEKGHAVSRRDSLSATFSPRTAYEYKLRCDTKENV